MGTSLFTLLSQNENFYPIIFSSRNKVTLNNAIKSANLDENEFAFTDDFDLIKELERGTSLSTLVLAVVPTLANNYSPAAIGALLEDTLLDVKLSVGGLK